MGQSIKHLYRRVDAGREYCFNIALSEQLSEEELDCLRLILADGFLIETVSEEASLTGERVVEVGPRLNFATAWSSNLVSICQATGLSKVVRVERSRRYLVPDGADIEDFVDNAHDRMTECLSKGYCSRPWRPSVAIVRAFHLCRPCVPSIRADCLGRLRRKPVLDGLIDTAEKNCRSHRRE